MQIGSLTITAHTEDKSARRLKLVYSLQDHKIEIRLGDTSAASIVGLANKSSQNGVNGEHAVPSSSYLQGSVESGIISGFQLATANGPLCDEPMWGLAFEVLFWHLIRPGARNASLSVLPIHLDLCWGSNPGGFRLHA